MGGPDLKFLGDLPPLVQLVLSLVVGAGIVAWVLPAYFQKLRAKPPENADLVLTAGTIADMKPVRDAAEHLKSIAENCATLTLLMVEQDRRALEREEDARDAELNRLRQVEADLKDKQVREGFRPPRRTRRSP
jgi:hypothetical protein